MPENVLYNDNRAVHQHARAKCEAAEGHDVQGQIEVVHQIEGRNDGDGDGKTDDQRGAEITKEDVQDHDRQQQAIDGRLIDLAQRYFDELRLIVRDYNADVGHVAFDALQFSPDVSDNANRVFIRFLVYGDANALLAIEPDDALHLFVCVFDGRNFAENNRNFLA